jgi:hypothetical protein
MIIFLISSFLPLAKLRTMIFVALVGARHAVPYAALFQIKVLSAFILVVIDSAAAMGL